MRSWLSFLAGNVKELNRQSESFVDEWSLLAETSSTNDILLLDVLLRRDLQTVTELSACPCLYRGQPTHCCRRIYFSTYPYLKQTIFNTWLLGLSPDLRVYCKIFQYLLTFCLNSMETSNPLSSVWQKIDRFILQMYNFPSLSLDTLDYIPQVHLLFQS